MNDTLVRLSEGPDTDTFRSIVWEYASHNPKEYPWRTSDDPWEVLVSEVMLQQTQTSRVVSKYLTFLACYPHPGALADSSIEELLGLWKGLGYNRRGLNLKRCAEVIVQEHGGWVPNDQEALEALPGIGPYTASAVRAFAFNEPVVLIETNIRRLFLFTFFPDRTQVSDREVLEVIAQALDASDPKGWYAALMDLGSALKSWVPNPNRKSTHYTKQTRFEGSNRQIRGRILEMLLSGPSTMDELEALPFDNKRIDEQVRALEREGFLVEDAGTCRLR